MARVLCFTLVLALAACSGERPETAAPARSTPGVGGLPAFDARAFAPAHPRRFVDASLAVQRLSPGATLRVDDRMGQPTFVWTQPSADASLRAAVRRLGPEAAARTHLAELAPLYSLTSAAAVQAELASLHDTGRGGVIARFRQRVQGIPVHATSLSVLMDRELQPLALAGNLSPDAEAAARAPLAFPLDEADAIDRALDDLHGSRLPREALGGSRLDQSGARLHQVVAAPAGVRFSRPPRTRRVLFQLPDRLEPATSVELMAGTHDRRDAVAYAYVFSAVDGRLLSRHDLTARDAFTYRVWADAAAPHLPAAGPQGTAATPYPGGVPADLDFPFVAPALVTLQSAPFSRNDPWLPPGATETSGNNVDAYADLDFIDGFTDGDLRADVTAPGVFDRTYDTTQPPGSSPDQTKAAVTQLFFVTNFLHDWFYDSGLDEASGNAQLENYGRGGAGEDPILAEGQDAEGFNNANMATPSDGAAPRMQMYVWTGADRGHVVITSPPGIAGEVRRVGVGDFGPLAFDLAGTLALVDDGSGDTAALGCAPLVNGAALAGKIALAVRGTCAFTAKARNAQAAGALGLLLVNNQAGILNMGGDDPEVTIPVLLVPKADGDTLLANLEAPVEVQLSRTQGVLRDGTIDNAIVAHEWGHYVSNRLIGDAAGLANNQGMSMGEGWSDFIALLMVVREGDDAVPGNQGWAGAYGLAGYALSSVYDSYYYGVRRMAYSTDLARNGLTLKHISAGVPLPDGPPTSFGQDGLDNAEVHNAGEVWATMLWECYAALLRDSGRLTFPEAQRRMKDILIASLKLTPPNPTFLEARDAVLAAALAYDPADHRLFLQAFAKRGAGTRAVAPDRYSPDQVGVVESVSAGADVALVSATLDDALAAPCGRTGVLAAGGAGFLTVTLRNVGPERLAATTATVASDLPGLTFPSGATLSFVAMPPGGSATARLRVALDASVTGRQVLALTLTVNDAAMAEPLLVEVREPVNHEAVAAQSASDDVEHPETTWTVESGRYSDGTMGWRRVSTAPGAHRWQTPALVSYGDEALVSPPFTLGQGPASLSFAHRYDYDVVPLSDGSSLYTSGGIIEISSDGETWSDLGYLATPGYDDVIGAGFLERHPAFVGRSAAFPAMTTTTLDLGTRWAGETVRVRFRSLVYAWVLAPATGWEVDDVALHGTIDLPFNALVGRDGACARVPVASIVAPAAGPTGQAITLDGTGSSDPGRLPLAYRWVQVGGPAAALDDDTAPNPSFTLAEASGPQPVTFALRVSNGLRWSAPVSATVTVEPPPPASGGGCSSAGGGLGGLLWPVMAVGLWLLRLGRPDSRPATVQVPASRRRALPLSALLAMAGGLVAGCADGGAKAKPVSPSWAASWDGGSKGTERVYGIAVDAGSAAYVVGETNDALTGVRSGVLLKYDATGALEWKVVSGGPDQLDCYFGAVAVDGAGDVLVTASSKMPNGSMEALLQKYGPDGTLRWQQRYQGALNGAEFGRIAVVAGDAIVVAGHSTNRYSGANGGLDFVTAKYGPDGTRRWLVLFNGDADNRDAVYALATDPAGNVYVTGTSGSIPEDPSAVSGDDWMTIKYSGDGVELWRVSYRDPAIDPTWGQTPHAIAVDAAGNVVVTGWAARAALGDTLTIKYDPSGVQLWERRYVGLFGCADGGVYVGLDAAGNAYVTGTVSNVDTGFEWLSDLFVVKYSPAGDELWSRTLDGPAGVSDAVTAAVLDRSGNLFVTGVGNFDINTGNVDALTAKFDASGALAWSVVHNAPTEAQIAIPTEIPMAIALGADGSVYTTAMGVTDPDPALAGVTDIVTLKNVNLLP